MRALLETTANRLLLFYYTIPKIKRELKQKVVTFAEFQDYTIPKIKKELKQQVEYI